MSTFSLYTLSNGWAAAIFLCFTAAIIRSMANSGRACFIQRFLKEQCIRVQTILLNSAWECQAARSLKGKTVANERNLSLVRVPVFQSGVLEITLKVNHCNRPRRQFEQIRFENQPAPMISVASAQKPWQDFFKFLYKKNSCSNKCERLLEQKLWWHKTRKKKQNG